jgi:predicted nucleic acid-binding protein
MKVILDSGGVTAVALDRTILKALLKKGAWPPLVPAAVLVESLTGDHRRDHHANRVLRLCTIRALEEIIARHAALLRYRSGRGDISAVDAIVAATADHAGGGVVWTSDPDDLHALAANTIHPVRVAKV